MTAPQKKRLKNPIQKYNDRLTSDQILGKKIVDKSTIACITGNFGTGKTHLAITYALEQLAQSKYKSDIKGIILTRPIIFEKERNLGFLPGNLFEKTQIFIEPMLAIIRELEGGDKVDSMLKDGILSSIPLMVAQGMTFTNKICIVSEAQNLTRTDVIDLYSRIGIGSKMIFEGDMNQVKLPKGVESGFPKLLEICNKSENINHCELIENHRSPIVEEMMNLY